MTKIAIFGVGLIGGSLALSFKGKPGLRVIGYSPNPTSVTKYMKHQVVDEATSDMREAAVNADFIFMCGPVGTLEQSLRELMNLPLKDGCIITDVGSTKLSLAQTAQSLQREGVWFIGGHPMAGKEKSGVEAASSRLFENAYYVLTPPDNIPEEPYNRLVSLLEHTKAQIVRLDPAMHDDIVGAISHLPHIIAVALVNQIKRYNNGNDWYKSLAAGGFRDITRIASSDPIVWRDILLGNRQVVLKLLDDWQEETSRFRQLIDQSDGDGIMREFVHAGAFRDAIPERSKGILTSLFDIYVDIPDEPGIIGAITTELGKHCINLSNIHIVESRLDVPGALRLSFRQEEDMIQALSLLSEMGCQASR